MDIVRFEILALTILVNIFLGLFTLARSPRSINNLLFFFLTLSISSWIASNYLIEAQSMPFIINSVFNRLAYFFGFTCLVLIALFCYSFANGLHMMRRKWGHIILLYGLVAVFSMTPWVAGGVHKTTDDLTFSVGKLIILYSAILLALLVSSAVSLRRALKAGGEKRSQAQILLFGIIASVTMIIVFNLIVPSLVGSFDTAKFGPLFSLIFVASFSYAIIKHKLFDVRLIVARLLGYLFSVGFLGLVYGFLAFNIIDNVFFRNSDIAFWQRTFNTVLAVTIAFTFQPVRRFFDRLTNKFFYQDAYDSQIFLDEFNRKLVSTVDLNKLLQECAVLIEDNMKPTFCAFVLKETEYEKQRVISRAQKHFAASDVTFARATLPKFDHKVIVADTLEDSNSTLRSRMRKNNVAALVRLTSAVDIEGVGVIVLGEKKSGNMYNSQDLQVLEIIANSLVIAIDNALRFEEIQKFNITLEQKVEDATRKLRHANDKLIALDQTKDDFISMASHQLRTPLTSVKGYLSMVLEGDTGKVNPQQAKMLEQAFTSSQRMVYLIADLLNVSRLRTGKFVIETKPTNLAEVIEGEIDQLKTTAAGKNQKLTYTKPKSFPTLMFDETKIRQVIMNFTDNALHYTPNNGKIHVALEETPTTIQFTVTDNGIGIPKHEQHHLFTKFFRAGNARKARPDGTGLGLFMAKKVIIAQGGSVVFMSHEGKGSTFGFTFSKASLKVPK